MTKRDFLLSLSKDELVELVFDFSETNRKACDFIQKKIYQAEVLGQNNKQENLLENPKAFHIPDFSNICSRRYFPAAVLNTFCFIGLIIQCEGLDEATGEKEYTMLWKQK